MDVFGECDTESNKENRPSDDGHELRESVPEPKNVIQPLDVSVLIQCGELVSDYFRLFVNDEISDDADDCISRAGSSTVFSEYGEITYMDMAVRQMFDWLYDTMSLDLERAELGYQTQPKLKLYDDLTDFMRYHRLHEINRYVFGDGPCADWGPNTVAALRTVREWRIRHQDEIEYIPDVLIETYETVAKSANAQPFQVAMVAFAVFGFLLGYDTTVDFELLYAFRDVKAVHDSTADFRRFRNSVTRHARMFLETHGADRDRERFETLAARPDFAALCEWVYDLAAERPDFAQRLASNPFDEDPEVPATAASDVVRLRVFYRWISREIFALFRGLSQHRISLLDDHVKRCLNCCLSTGSRLKMFNDTYAHVLVHFTKILVEYECPAPMLETLHSTWHQKAFKGLVRLFVKKLFDRNSKLRYRDSSTGSDVSSGYT